ncbi:MAG TPA: hypothetical protein VIK59_08425 [Verrucomicrobiae bacterium]
MMKNQMQVRPKFIAMLIIAFGTVWLIALLLPSLASTGKPTPRQRAYRRCLDYAKFVNYAATNNQFTLDISKFTDQKVSSNYQSGALVHLLLSAQDLAKQDENYLIKTNCNTAKTNREIIIVCEKQFEYDEFNTSLWNLFKHNYVYVVGCSDGKAGFITPTDFTNLDLRGFSGLSQVATNALAIYFAK